MTELKIATKLGLPLDIVSEALGVLARRGRGKTYTASVIAEEMLEHHVQTVALDPTGAWWGLREGYPVIIMGGEHGDVPLEPSAGAVVADFIVQEGFSVVLDLSLFESRADEIRFATAFFERLYRAKKKGTGVLHLFVDEASVFAPQNVRGDTAKMVGAIESIVRRGRIKGLGCTLIDQRPASVNKNVLTQAKGLIVLGVSAPTDRKAIMEWVQARGADLSKEMIDSLPSMEVGEAWVWLPDLDIFERIRIRKRRTFDSSSTPKPGEKARKPKDWSDVDLASVQTRMAETIERAKAEDPKVLQREITALRKRLRSAESEAASAGQGEPPEPVIEVKIEKVEVPTLKKDEIERLERIALTISEAAGQMASAAAAIAEQLKDTTSRQDEVLAKLDEATKERTRTRTSAPIKSAPVSRRPRSAPPSRPAPADTPVDIEGDFQPSKPQQRILNALAWMESIGRDATAKTQLALLADARPTSGAYKNNLGGLRSAGFITYPTAGQVALTDAGRAIAEIDGVPQTDEELWDAIFAKVGPTKAKILQVVIDIHPEMIDKSALAERTDQTPTSGAYKNNLGFLRTMGLIDYPQAGFVAATDALFLEGA